MNTKYILSFLILIYACNPTSKKGASNKIILDTARELYDFKIYAHLDSLEIMEYVQTDDGEKTSLSNPSLFLYRDQADQIRIAYKKAAEWYAWTIFDASNYAYTATVELKNFDNEGMDDLVITSTYGISPQSTMGSEYFGNTEIWDLEQVHQYFTIEHYSYSDDMGRNGDNTFSKEFKLSIKIDPLSITISDDLEREQNSKEEDYPKYYRLIDNEVVEVANK